MLKLIKHIFFIVLILLSTTAFSQSKKALQEKKAQIEKDIQYTNKLLGKTKKSKPRVCARNHREREKEKQSSVKKIVWKQRNKKSKTKKQTKYRLKKNF